jgi:hypothetical protein
MVSAIRVVCVCPVAPTGVVWRCGVSVGVALRRVVVPPCVVASLAAGSIPVVIPAAAP